MAFESEKEGQEETAKGRKKMMGRSDLSTSEARHVQVDSARKHGRRTWRGVDMVRSASFRIFKARAATEAKSFNSPNFSPKSCSGAEGGIG